MTPYTPTSPIIAPWPLTSPPGRSGSACATTSTPKIPRLCLSSLGTFRLARGWAQRRTGPSGLFGPTRSSLISACLSRPSSSRPCSSPARSGVPGHGEHASGREQAAVLLPQLTVSPGSILPSFRFLEGQHVTANMWVAPRFSFDFLAQRVL